MSSEIISEERAEMLLESRTMRNWHLTRFSGDMVFSPITACVPDCCFICREAIALAIGLDDMHVLQQAIEHLGPRSPIIREGSVRRLNGRLASQDAGCSQVCCHVEEQTGFSRRDGGTDFVDHDRPWLLSPHDPAASE
ncbi:hypothetical protein ABIB82_004965 [Bradyrhizobium sp. i1.8.4]|uniref:hypothetical protein n=1 Tax=unclassified Bradyrhizobium TaxID=2631580 RepID=UPI003D22A8A5